jgi:hypothetical protein
VALGDEFMEFVFSSSGGRHPLDPSPTKKEKSIKKRIKNANHKY